MRELLLIFVGFVALAAVLALMKTVREAVSVRWHARRLNMDHRDYRSQMVRQYGSPVPDPTLVRYYAEAAQEEAERALHKSEADEVQWKLEREGIDDFIGLLTRAGKSPSEIAAIREAFEARGSVGVREWVVKNWPHSGDPW